jgi:hypothetical protein
MGDPNPHLDVIDTEILAMELKGGGYTLRAGAGQGEGAPLTATKGTIVEQASDPTLADSFFDVFFEVELPGGGYAYNQTPLRVSSVIDCVPPESDYIHPDQPITLYDSPVVGQGNIVARIISARHRVGPPTPGLNCDLTGPAAVCVDTDPVYGVTAALAPATYAWSVSGSGSITGPANGATVTIAAPPNAGSYTVQVIITAGSLADTCERVVTVTSEGCTPVAVAGERPAISQFELSAPVPNPTSGASRVEFTVARESFVELAVHDVQGRRVASLTSARYQPGRYEVTWNGTIGRRSAPAGLYFIRYTTPERTLVRRVALVR